MIKKDQIKELLELRENIKSIQSELEELMADEKQLNDKIVSAIEANDQVQFMPFKLSIRDYGQRRPAWKDIVEQKLGGAFVKQVISETTPGVSKKVIIEAASAINNSVN